MTVSVPKAKRRTKKPSKPVRNTVKKRTGMENPFANHMLPDSPIVGPVLFVDGGTNFLGYSVYTYTPGMSLSDSVPLDWGTLYAEGKDHTSYHALRRRALDVIDLAGSVGAATMVLESYGFIPGKSSGIFVVPSLLAVIAALWLSVDGRNLYCVPPSEWKNAICRNPNATKDIVRENGIVNILPATVMKKIHDRYELKKQEVEARIGKKITTEYGEQDCIDALSMGLYVTNRSVILSRRTEGGLI